MFIMKCTLLLMFMGHETLLFSILLDFMLEITIKYDLYIH